MRHRALRSAVALLAGTIGLYSPFGHAQEAAPKPDLVVMLAIDQFGSVLFNRWRPTFEAGLKRLSADGVVFANGYQSHGITETCAGHSTLLTGKHPSGTGIVANEWYNGTTGKQVYCVEDASVAAADSPKARRVGPALLATSTLGDWLKEQSPQSRVVSVSGKDRASITMGGRKADAVFWYVDGFGFSTYVEAGQEAAARLAPLAALNTRIAAEAPTLPEWAYAKESCRALESDFKVGDAVWHSKLPPENPPEGGKPPEKVRAVHVIDPLTLEAARVLTEHYQLGQRGQTDLLAVSLSATDFIGHGFGTGGPEMCDQMYRLDRMVGEFLQYLEGLKRNVVVVVTGDHGGSDIPERLARQGDGSAKRVSSNALLAAANAAVKDQLKLDANPLTSPDGVQFYAVDKDGRALPEPARAQVANAAAAFFNGRPEVEAAFTLDALLAHKVKASAPSDYTLEDRFSQSAMAGRSGDVVLALKSGLTAARALPTRFMMGHAGPYYHDTAVPIIFWWPKAQAQTRILPVDTTSIAPTLASLAGIKAPADLDGRCLDIGYGRRCD